MSGRGVKKGGTWRTLKVSDIEDMVIPDVMNDVFLPKRTYPENFVLIFQLKVFLEGGGQEVGYLEDVEGS